MAYGEYYGCEICHKTVVRRVGWSHAAQQMGKIPEGWDNIHGIGWICGDCIEAAFGPRDKDKGPGAQMRTLPDRKADDTFWEEWNPVESD